MNYPLLNSLVTHVLKSVNVTPLVETVAVVTCNQATTTMVMMIVHPVRHARNNSEMAMMMTMIRQHLEVKKVPKVREERETGE
jgi:hypothetical protein